MPLIPFGSLPDDSRLWGFGAGRMLSEAEAEELLRSVDGFLEEWAAHGTPLTAGRELRERQFLLVAVDERSVPPSGCSIDAFVRCLKGLESELGTLLVDHARIWFRDRGEVRCVSRAEFRGLAGDGVVGEGTTVFDLTAARLGAVRESGIERPAEDGWHSALLAPGRTGSR